MKLRNIFSFICFAFFLLFCAVSCNGDICKNVPCQNGACVEGDCLCTTGYEGVECEKETRSKFLGFYTVNEECGVNPDNFQCLIQISSSAVYEVTFSNFYNLQSLGVSQLVKGTVDGTTMTIPPQTLGVYTFEGNGTVYPDSGFMDISYSTLEDTVLTPCTARFTLN